MELPSLPCRKAQSHKGDYGRVLIVGGSRGMAGAVGLAGMAATRSGAGLTTLAVPDCCLETVAGYDANYMTVPLSNDSEGRIIHQACVKLDELASRATSIGIGPGLATGGELERVVVDLYSKFTGPMVVDADALNALVSARHDLGLAAGPRVLTPHVGEFRRLVGATPQQLESPDDCSEFAVRLAAKFKLIIVLKGQHTLVSDGSTTFANTTGNPGMATGGSGDVLTGVITALLGQGLTELQSAVLGVFVHGRAGDLARDIFGEVSMVASDIKDQLGAAFRSLD